jgi:hypothetical protein
VWWMALPALLALAAEPRPDPQAARTLADDIAARLRAAETNGYRLDTR